MKISRKEKIVGVFIILIVIVYFIPTAYYVRSPGIARKLTPIINVEDGYRENIEGDFLLTAVSSQSASFLDILFISLFNPPDKELVAVHQGLPPGVDMNRYIKMMEQLMEESKLHSQAAAFEEAGEEVIVTGKGALVVDIMEEGSAQGILKREDIIIAVENKKIEFASDAVNNIRKKEIGEKIKLTILRENKEKVFELETIELENEPGKASIGVLITTHELEFDFPREVKFATEKIVGPSAGGMFALEIFNQLIPEDITRGNKIAGTGTISSEGKIGKIDGVRFKVMAAEAAGSDIFISPEENFDNAREAAQNIEVVSVDNFREIIQYLEEVEIKKQS